MLISRLVVLLMFLTATGAAFPGEQDLDWIGPQDRAYQVLIRAQNVAPQEGYFGAQWLMQGKSLPQSTARLLADRFKRDPRISAEFRKELDEALPSEAEVLRSQLNAGTATASVVAALEDLDKALSEKEAVLARNQYSPTSTPGTWITFGAGYEPYSFGGLVRRQGGWLTNSMTAQFNGQVGPAGYMVKLVHSLPELRTTSQSTTESPVSINPFADSSVKLSLDGGWIHGLELTLGFVPDTMSRLLWAMPTYPYQGFFFQNAVGSSGLQADVPSGDRNSQGFQFRKRGTQTFWPFEDTRLIFAPEQEQYADFNYNHGWASALRLDTPSLGFVPGTDGIQLFGFGMVTGSDRAQLQSFADNSLYYGAASVPNSGVAYSGGLEAQLAGGGSLLVEYAMSSWTQDPGTPGLAPLSLNGTALYSSLTKSFGRLSFGVDYARVDPGFVPGGLAQIFNSTSGIVRNTMFYDFPRYTTVDRGLLLAAEEPAWISNNSQKVGLQLSWSDGWGGLTLSLGSSEQIVPSGPWIRAASSINNSPYNGYSWFDLFINNYSLYPYSSVWDPGMNRALFDYNKQTQAPATQASGAPLKYFVTQNGQVNWDDLEQLEWKHTTHLFWLSNGGVGSSVLASDSIKVYNTARAEVNLELGSLLDMERRAKAVLYYEVRDSAAERRLATGSASGLLLQTVMGADLSWQVGQTWELVSTGGYETFFSEAGRFGTRFADSSAGIGFNALLDGQLEGLKIGAKLLALGHKDTLYPTRDFAGWRLGIGTTYTFAN